MSRFAWLLCAAFALSMAFGPSSWAQDSEPPPDETGSDAPDFDSLIEAAATAYSAKDYAQALQLFKEAYAINPEPSLLYNMGIIADKAGDFDLAIQYLNDYVLGRDVDVDAREDALRRLEQLRKLQELRDRDKTPVEPEPPVEPDPPIEPEPPIEPVEPDPPIIEPPVVVADGPSYLGPIVTFSAAAALLAGGGVSAALASSQYSAFEDATSLADRRDAADSGETAALAADILFATGGAVAVGALIWTLVIAMDDAPDDANTIGIHPWTSPNGAGLGMTLCF